MDSDTTFLEGMVEEIIYTNDANGYTVCAIDTGGEIVTATGCMPYLAEGESVKVTGKWTTHPEYGEQFGVMLYEKIAPKAAAAIFRYLASGAVKGIRLATARKIVDKFGDESLNVLLNAPEKLASISGISEAKALEMGREYAQQQGVSSIVMFLQQYGIGTQTALKVFRRFGSDAVSYIKDDPYVLVDEIGGVGFKTVDRMAYTMGILPQNISRLKAGIKYILNENAMSKGHTYIPADALKMTASQLLGVDDDEIERAMYSLRGENGIDVCEIEGTECIFSHRMYEAEKYICAAVSFRAQKTGVMSEDEAARRVDKWQEKNDMHLADEQRNAVIRALSSRISVLTGGPGTGKTTIVNTIIEILGEDEISIALTAPTGRAAKRMSEVTGLEAKTIHRLLEISYSENEELNVFARDETYPLDEDVIIVDETSMVDVLLGSALFKALKPAASIIMVGDANQLPPVGAGNMLGDIIAGGTVKTTRLTEIFRQAAQSMIVRNAHRIIGGENPVLNCAGSDFYYVARSGAEQIAQCIAELCKKRLPDAYGYNSMTQIQVLSAMKKGVCGTKNLNKILQKELNPSSPKKKEHKSGENILREGDRVMQIKNNYDTEWKYTDGSGEGTGVFNGDMGFIESIDAVSRRIGVIYDDKRVFYSFDMLDELELSYAVTVHKSQGSEFDVVVMPVYYAAPMLMKRNLLYTALTRAKKLVVLAGVEDAIYAMVSSDSENRRYTAMEWMLENEQNQDSRKEN